MRVPSSAVFRNEPLLRRILLCCITVAMACPALARGTSLLSIASSLAAVGGLLLSSSSGGRWWRFGESDASLSGAWLIRRNESFDMSEPDKVRLWPLLALPERALPEMCC